MRRPPEAYLVDAVLHWGNETGIAATEVATHGRSRADVVVVDAEGNVIVVEAKVKDWRRALHQAVLNRYVADASYIALWWNAISPACERACAELGIGLLSIEHGRCQIVVEPREGDNAHLSLRAAVARRVVGSV